jgi:hypothetical protein
VFYSVPTSSSYFDFHSNELKDKSKQLKAIKNLHMHFKSLWIRNLQVTLYLTLLFVWPTSFHRILFLKQNYKCSSSSIIVIVLLSAKSSTPWTLWKCQYHFTAPWILNVSANWTFPCQFYWKFLEFFLAYRQMNTAAVIYTFRISHLQVCEYITPSLVINIIHIGRNSCNNYAVGLRMAPCSQNVYVEVYETCDKRLKLVFFFLSSF